MFYIPFKHTLKQMAGGVAVLANGVRRPSLRSTAVVLTYHRVADTGCFDGSIDDWNVTPRRFERQINWLAKCADCISLGQIPAKLTEHQGGKPLVAVTFDDGFGNFATQALPILEQYRVPAAVFLVTRFVGTAEPYPFDRWAHRNWARTGRASWLPLTWEQVEQSLQSGLVTFGSHSDTHSMPESMTPEALQREATESRATLKRRLGEAHAFAYAYPYGSTRLGQVTDLHIEAVRTAGFTMGFTTDLGTVQSGASPFILPRVEAHAWDGSRVIAAKAHGVLWPFHLTDRLRRARRSSIPHDNS